MNATTMKITTPRQAIRILFPRLRRTTATGIVRNGSGRRVVECCVCGAQDSESGRYPTTKHMRQFRAEHDNRCGAELVRRANKEAS